MKVCLDIQAALGQRAGVGRYARELWRHAGTAAGEDTLRAFCFNFKGVAVEAPGAGTETKVCRWLPGRMAQAAWKWMGFPPYDWLAGEADVYHFPNFIRPPLSKGKRSVVTVHDVSFLRMPETTEARNLAWLTANIRRTVERADAVLTDSEFSAGEIQECLGVPSEKVTAVPLGVETRAGGLDEETRRAELKGLGLEGKEYLLMVGTVEPRKNIPFLVRVFEALKDFRGELVLAGGLGWKTEEALQAVETSPERARIRMVRHVGDTSLEALYEGAAAFVFPSRYEGFGLPPLEAMARGTPVISARNSSLPEVLGDAAAWVGTECVEAWVETLGRVLKDEGERERLRAAGRVQAAKFRWEETARRTWEVYRRVGAMD